MRRRLLLFLCVLSCGRFVGTRVASAEELEPRSAQSATKPTAPIRQDGEASFYAQRLSGRRTASGERYDPLAMTAAHRTLPMGTRVRIVNPRNERSVVVTINDRGPVARGRMIDLSAAAADQLGIQRAGVARVHLEVIGTASEAEADFR